MYTKTSVKEIEKLQINGIHPVFTVSKNSLKCAYCPIYKFSAIPIKISNALFTEIEKAIIKFIQNHERPPIAKAILKKNSIEDITLPDIKFCYTAIIINTAQ